MSPHPIVLVTPFALLFALAAPASAQTPPPGGGPGMMGLPRTSEEVRSWAERLFVEYDANRDGALTEVELTPPTDPATGPTGGTMGGGRLRGMILRADADGDARVTLAELTTGAQQMFDRMSRGPGGPGAGTGGGAPGPGGPGPGLPGMGGPGGGAGLFSLPRTADAVPPWSGQLFTRLDANQDGSITGNEMAILANPMVASMGGSRLRAMIAQSDANRDSRISPEEMTAGAQRMFNRMDVNGDGRLSDEELPRPPAPPAPVNIPRADPMPFPEMGNGG